MHTMSLLMLPIILNKLKKRLDSVNAGLLNEYDLSKLHLLYLLMLFENAAGMTLKELSDHLGFDKANTSRAIAQLTSKGYVQKNIQGDLELKYKVALTPKGREVAALIWERNQQANMALVQLFSPEEMSALSQVAGKLWQYLSGDETG